MILRAAIYLMIAMLITHPEKTGVILGGLSVIMASWFLLFYVIRGKQ